jgi:steroid delta-isomerase-like uncharacterized protein
MTTSEQDLGRRWFDQVWNQRRREAIAEMLVPDAKLHDGSVESSGPEGFYPFFDRLSTAFSDLKVHVDDTFGEGDKLCVRWTSTANHTGAGLGMPPTGKAIRVTGVTIFRVANGQIAEAWQNWDMLGLMEELNGLSRSATYVG